MTCPVCGKDMMVIMNEPMGKILSCPEGHERVEHYTFENPFRNDVHEYGT